MDHLLYNIDKYGVSLVIVVVAIAQFLPFTKRINYKIEEILLEQRKTNEILLNTISHNLKGDKLLLLVRLKVKDLRFNVQNELITRIDNNSISRNYNTIISEMQTFVNVEFLTFKNVLRQFTDTTTFNFIVPIVQKAVDDNRKLIRSLFEELRDLEKDEDNYETAKRQLRGHLERVQQELIDTLSEIIKED